MRPLVLDLDKPWQIAVLVLAIGVLRLIWTVAKDAPYRAAMLEVTDSLLIAFALVFLLIKPFVVAAFWIPSGSMEATLLPRDRVLVNKFIFHLAQPRRQDVIVFKAPPQATLDGTQKDFIKRLIGLPGDVVKIRGYDGVYINGVKLKEPYIGPLQTPEYDYGPERVPPEHYFVMGDNRNDSNDSHKWGDLPARNVLGKAMVIFWPPRRIGLVK